LGDLLQRESIVVGYGFFNFKGKKKDAHSLREWKGLVATTKDLNRVGAYKIGPAFGGLLNRAIREMRLQTDLPIIYDPEHKGLLTVSLMEKIDGLVTSSSIQRKKYWVQFCRKRNIVPLVKVEGLEESPGTISSNRIDALKKMMDLGVKDYVLIEPDKVLMQDLFNLFRGLGESDFSLFVNGISRRRNISDVQEMVSLVKKDGEGLWHPVLQEQNYPVRNRIKGPVFRNYNAQIEKVISG